MQVKEKVALLRAKMMENNIDAFIIFSADPHMSEYLPTEWKEREWISGFTGSAGFVVITKDKAGLWTDGRYFTQAEEELIGSGIDLYKEGVEDTPNYIDWIIEETSEQGKVAVNALSTSHANWQAIDKKLTQYQRQLLHLPLMDQVWMDRGTNSTPPIYLHPVERAGTTAVEKISNIKSSMQDFGANVHIITTLDDIAWTLNLRGSDVECNPVFLAYLLITKDQTTLFVDENKVDQNVRQQMEYAAVNIQAYSDFLDRLKDIKNEKILLAPNCNQLIFETLKDHNQIIVKSAPSSLMKALKNPTELAGARTVMVRDGVAMVKFLYWLTHEVGKTPLNEYEIGQQLRKFRAQGDNFVGESFNSIVGYQGNGAIIHYSAKSKGSAQIEKHGSILIDSGGQYLEGTTDITRTVPLGAINDDFKRDYTLVLQGHIRLSQSKFPKGTRGAHLDTLARIALWEEGKDYNHGTGHGVGSFLNVHEGPQNIRKDLNPQELLPGMIISNEPGYYVVGQYGIRHENLIVVKEWKKTEWNTFYEFETLTFCPFFKSPIVKELLTPSEIKWLNDYHQQCKDKLSPHLNGETLEWFLDLVSPI